MTIGNESCGAAIGTKTLNGNTTYKYKTTQGRLENMFGLGIIGTILLILLVLWLLGIL